MNLYNFVIKSIMLTFTVAICISGCQNRKSIAFEEISKYVVDSIIRKDCCDTIMLTKNVIVCLLYTSDAADERSSVDLGGRRIIKKKKKNGYTGGERY